LLSARSIRHGVGLAYGSGIDVAVMRDSLLGVLLCSSFHYALPFTAAVALTRDMSNPLTYNDEALRDPVVRDLAQRIELVPLEDATHAGPASLQADILLEYAGQRYTLSTQSHKGSPHNPFTWEEVCDKFRRFTVSIVGARQATACIEAVGSLEQAADMATVAQLVTRM